MARAQIVPRRLQTRGDGVSNADTRQGGLLASIRSVRRLCDDNRDVYGYCAENDAAYEGAEKFCRSILPEDKLNAARTYRTPAWGLSRSSDFVRDDGRGQTYLHCDMTNLLEGVTSGLANAGVHTSITILYPDGPDSSYCLGGPGAGQSKPNSAGACAEYELGGLTFTVAAGITLGDETKSVLTAERESMESAANDVAERLGRSR